MISIASWSPRKSEPLTVSNACDSHESSGFRAALMPPAAALECERTGWTLLKIATVAPERAAASAARWPARPAPMINTSWEGMARESIGATGPDVSRPIAAPRHGAPPPSVILGVENDPSPQPAPRAGARRRRPRRRALPRARDPRGRGARGRVRRRGLERRGGGRRAGLAGARRGRARRPHAADRRLRGGRDAARALPRAADPALLGDRRRRDPRARGRGGHRGLPLQGPLRGDPPRGRGA